MLLESIGETIDPSLIEILTGGGLGAVWNHQKNLLYFSQISPEKGISKALEILGFQYIESRCAEDDQASIEIFKERLETSPIVFGPLEMIELTYLPFTPPRGVDHYFYAYKVDGEQIYLHDPQGYPSAVIPFENVTIGNWEMNYPLYQSGQTNKYWCNPKRERIPTEDEIFDQALHFYKESYYESHQAAVQKSLRVGSDAIMALIEYMKYEELSLAVLGHMKGFLFPLAVKRALDFSIFLKSKHKPLSSLKERQAEYLIKSFDQLAEEDYEGFIHSLYNLVEIEHRLTNLIMNS